MGLQEPFHRRAAGRRGEHGENPRPPAADRRGNPPPRAGRGRRAHRLEGAPAPARSRRQRPHRAAVPHRGAGRLLCRDRGPRHGHQRLPGDDPHPDRAGRGRGHRLRGRPAGLHPSGPCAPAPPPPASATAPTSSPCSRPPACIEAKGQAAEARALYTDILAAEPDWPEALHAAFWFHVDQGDLARVRTTLADARRDYEEAHRLAQRLTAGDPSNTAMAARPVGVLRSGSATWRWPRASWTTPRAPTATAWRFAKKLAAGDPTNTEWQRDLSVSYIEARRRGGGPGPAGRGRAGLRRRPGDSQEAGGERPQQHPMAARPVGFPTTSSATWRWRRASWRRPRGPTATAWRS